MAQRSFDPIVVLSHWVAVLLCWLSVHPLVGAADDWPQFQYNGASHGRAAQAVEPPFQLRWVWYGEENVVLAGRPFPSGDVPRPPRKTTGLLSFTMHPVVADGRVVFGDLPGKLYCLDSADGTTIWSRQFPGAFVYAAAIYQEESPERNVIVASCQDGNLYGLDWDGKTLWTVRAQRPFVTPPKLEDRTAYAGSLDGKIYALDVPTGEVKWTFDASAAIRQPAAVADGKLFFGSENMIFHALDARTGKELWRTDKGTFTGQSFRNTWPVVVGDKVMTFQTLVDGQAEYVMESLLYNATPGDHTQKRLSDWPQEREAILAWLAGDPTYAVDCNKYWENDPGKIKPETRSRRWAGGPLRKSFYVFDVDGDGQGRAVEPFQVPMGIVGGTGNANMGATLDAQGRPLLWWRVSASSIITGAGFGTAFSPDVSGLDLATGDRIILPAARDGRGGGPGMELDNHHMLTAAGDYLYYHNPFRQARWIKLDGRVNPAGKISAAYAQHDGGGWQADVVYYRTKDAAGDRAEVMFDSHGAARTPVVIADGALFVNEIDIRGVACYETRRNGARDRGPEAVAPITAPRSSSAITSPPPGETEGKPAVDGANPDYADEQPTTLLDPSHYVWEKRVVRKFDAGSQDLQTILEQQIRIVLESGHLLPYYCKRGELNPRWYFTNPGDTIAVLARAFPYIPGGLQDELRSYLRRELAEYPPCSEKLNAPTDSGTSRMDFAVPVHLQEWGEGGLYRSLPRLHNVYGVWLYADATGDSGYVHDQWEEICRFYAVHRNDRTAYFGGIAAPIAMARLADLVGDDARRDAFAGEAAEALQAVRREPQMRAEMLARYGFERRWTETFNWAGFHLLGITPEVARHVRHHAEVKEDLSSHISRGTVHWPMWYLSQASTFSRYYGESHAISPLFSATIFPVQALVFEAAPEHLRRWVDAEDAPRGDLYFIERLVLAIEVHGHEQWQDVRRRNSGPK